MWGFPLADYSVIINTKFKKLGPLKFRLEWMLLFQSNEKDYPPYKFMLFFTFSIMAYPWYENCYYWWPMGDSILV